MDFIRTLFERSEPLLLFFVVGLGYLIGKIKIRGFSLGISAVLFLGLFVGSWRPEGSEPLRISTEISEVGLILFVYVVGVSSGAGFFDSFKKRGLPFNLIVSICLVLGAVFALFAGRFLGLSIGQIAGVYCGGLTNTPALAAVTEAIKITGEHSSADPAVGYTIAYPYAVIFGIVAFNIFHGLFSKRRGPDSGQSSALVVRNYQVTNPAVCDKTVGEMRVRDRTGLMISRIRHKDGVVIPNKYTILHEGDVLTAVGSREDIDKAVEFFGSESQERLDESRRDIDFLRILVSRRSLVGKTITELDLARRFQSQVTRLRRADVEIVPSPDTALEWGDRLMVVAPHSQVKAVSDFFGDSVRGLAEMDFVALTLGITLGVLAGMIPIPVPGGTTISLGFAGGPLIVGLIAGRLSRTGSLVWSIPLEISQTLSHIGILFFLAGVGVRSGGDFLAAISQSGGKIFLLGVGVSSFTTLLALFLLKYIARGDVVDCMGATSGMQTQPATLTCAHELTGSSQAYISYATTYPVAMIGKILLAQLIYILGRSLF